MFNPTLRKIRVPTQPDFSGINQNAKLTYDLAQKLGQGINNLANDMASTQTMEEVQKAGTVGEMLKASTGRANTRTRNAISGMIQNRQLQDRNSREDIKARKQEDKAAKWLATKLAQQDALNQQKLDFYAKKNKLSKADKIDQFKIMSQLRLNADKRRALALGKIGIDINDIKNKRNRQSNLSYIQESTPLKVKQAREVGNEKMGIALAKKAFADEMSLQNLPEQIKAKAQAEEKNLPYSKRLKNASDTVNYMNLVSQPLVQALMLNNPEKMINSGLTLNKLTNNRFDKFGHKIATSSEQILRKPDKTAAFAPDIKKALPSIFGN